MLTNPLSALFPPLALILAGYLFARISNQREHYEEVLGSFSFKLAVPALLFVSATEADLPQRVAWPFFIAFYGPMLLIFVLAWVFGRFGHWQESLTSAGYASLAMQASYSNITIIGIPVVLYLLGQEALAPLMLIIVVHDIALFFIGTLAAELGQAHRRSLLATWISLLLSLLTRPVTAALIAGLGLNLMGIHLPLPIADGFHLLGQAGIPTALLVLGIKSVGMGCLDNKRQLMLVVSLKLVLFPLLVGLMAFVVFDLPYIQAATMVVGASMPVGVSALIFSAAYGVLEREAAAAIVVSNICFIGTFAIVTACLSV